MADEEIREEADTPGSGQDGTAARRRWPVVTAAAVAVAVVAGGLYGAQALTGDDADDPAGDADEALVLDAPPAFPMAAAPEAASEAAAGDGAAPAWPGAATLRLAESPADAPDEAAVYRFEGVAEERVAELGAALGLDGAPQRGAEDSWTMAGAGAGADAPALNVVGEPGFWYYGPEAELSISVGGPDGTVSSEASADDGADRRADDGADGGEAPSEAEALAAADEVLDALGLGDAAVDARETSGADRIVSAAPVIDGLPVHGLDTELYIGPDGELTMAFGTLHAFAAAEERSVTGAEDAVEEYNRTAGDVELPAIQCGAGDPAGQPEPLPLPMPEEAEAEAGGDAQRQEADGTCPSPAGKPEPVSVTAEFGLAMTYAEEEPVLVPSWLFRGERESGEAFAASQPAVPHEYRTQSDGGAGQSEEAPAQPAEPEEQPGAGAGGDGAEPGQSQPGAPGEAPDGTETGWSVEPYEESAESLTVTFWASPCDEYEATARESGDEVAVHVDVVNPDPERMCIQLAEERTAEVELDEPVGERTLTDEQGRELPVG
ncbi:hypothetical protein [Streptomyces sp. MP131-18]|uniref:hypothetical protein n=1 Tax=Streptomyces sp. MP131-18 TaxID=1857892 RepID=UPI00097C1325|nr:hypothetical protein [Streptomyces sp. MP131-18]ONK14960.1 hypothetical protein STBA_57720 [Streptomyces sp. MP131-18]